MNDNKVPEVIPDSCDKCEYWHQKKSFFNRYGGQCRFYNTETYFGSQCLATIPTYSEQPVNADVSISTSPSEAPVENAPSNTRPSFWGPIIVLLLAGLSTVVAPWPASSMIPRSSNRYSPYGLGPYAALAEVKNREAQIEGLSLAITLILLTIGIIWLLYVIIRRASKARQNSENFMIEVEKDLQERQTRLLCETDHQAILEACRELLLQVNRGDLKPRTYTILREPDPLSAQFPQPILDLAPSYVYIDEQKSGYLKLEMDGRLHNYGLCAYPDDFKEPFSNFEYGDKKLIEGLWYYDDGYSDPEYEKTIDALLQKNKRLK